MPDLVTLGPPVMVRPSEFSLLSPAVTLSTMMSLASFSLCATSYGFADDVAVAFDIDGVAQCVVVACRWYRRS